MPFFNSRIMASQGTAPAQQTLLPLELVDKAIGSRIHVIMKNDRELVGKKIIKIYNF